jgi:hypothetical protein
MKKILEAHAFSIELHNKAGMKTLIIPNSTNSSILVEGFLGKLEGACFVEGSMLEIQGANGAIRIDLVTEEFKRLIKRQREVKQ